jgi:hypothetical protein
MITKNTYERFYYGDSITNEELLALLAYYNNIKKSVMCTSFVPHEFRLFVSEVIRITNMLESFAFARGLELFESHDQVDVSLTKEQAYLIKSLVQNYMGDDPDSETAEERELRKSVFDALPGFEELSKGK